MKLFQFHNALWWVTYRWWTLVLTYHAWLYLCARLLRKTTTYNPNIPLDFLQMQVESESFCGVISINSCLLYLELSWGLIQVESLYGWWVNHSVWWIITFTWTSEIMTSVPYDSFPHHALSSQVHGWVIWTQRWDGEDETPYLLCARCACSGRLSASSCAGCVDSSASRGTLWCTPLLLGAGNTWNRTCFPQALNPQGIQRMISHCRKGIQQSKPAKADLCSALRRYLQITWFWFILCASHFVALSSQWDRGVVKTLLSQTFLTLVHC